MIKITGCLLLFISCSLIGCMKANTYKARSVELKEIIEIIRLIDMYITYRKEPLVNTFAKLINAKECWFTNVLNECVYCLNNNFDIEKSWRNSIDKHLENSPLIEDDILILNEVITGLGKSDSEGQRRIIEPILIRLENNYQNSVTKERSMGKMYRTLGMAVGLVLAIVIF